MFLANNFAAKLASRMDGKAKYVTKTGKQKSAHEKTASNFSETVFL